MYKKLKYLFFTVSAILVMTNKQKICQHLGFGQAKLHHPEQFTDHLTEDVPEDYDPEVILMSDSVFVWDMILFDFIPVRAFNPVKDWSSPFPAIAAQNKNEKPVKLTWKTMMDIEYVLKYYEEVGMDIYAPIFTNKLKKLNGKLVEVEGYVIPYDETGAEIALSANPFASCFFCGKASPASIMSLKLARQGETYKMDDYLKFTGRLRLNDDDPNELYYVLEGAKEL